MDEDKINLLMRKLFEKEIKDNILVSKPILKNGWIIKCSIVHDHIIIHILSTLTGQYISKYFISEDSANEFVQMIVDLPANEEFHQQSKE